jgi:O-antigen/teichoic acid export membrane protein
VAAKNKMNTRTSRAFQGTLTSFLQFGLVIILQIFLAPIVLKYAGQETLGAFSIIMQIVSYLALLDLGFSVSTNRFLPQAFGKDDNLKYFKDI